VRAAGGGCRCKKEANGIGAHKHDRGKRWPRLNRREMRLRRCAAQALDVNQWEREHRVCCRTQMICPATRFGQRPGDNDRAPPNW